MPGAGRQGDAPADRSGIARRRETARLPLVEDRLLLRRPHHLLSSERRFGNLVLDSTGRRVSVAGRTIDLGGREFRLLEVFLANLGQVLSKDTLLDQLFGLDKVVAPNVVELYVSRLRRKLEGAAVGIRTVRGLGYIAESRDAAPGSDSLTAC